MPIWSNLCWRTPRFVEKLSLHSISKQTVPQTSKIWRGLAPVLAAVCLFGPPARKVITCIAKNKHWPKLLKLLQLNDATTALVAFMNMKPWIIQGNIPTRLDNETGHASEHSMQYALCGIFIAPLETLTKCVSWGVEMWETVGSIKEDSHLCIDMDWGVLTKNEDLLLCWHWPGGRTVARVHWVAFRRSTELQQGGAATEPCPRSSSQFKYLWKKTSILACHFGLWQQTNRPAQEIKGDWVQHKVMKRLAILMSPSAFGCGSNLRFLKTQETTNIYSLSISPIFEAAFFSPAAWTRKFSNPMAPNFSGRWPLFAGREHPSAHLGKAAGTTVASTTVAGTWWASGDRISQILKSKGVTMYHRDH